MRIYPILTDEKDLTVGRWYAIGFKNVDGVIEWGGAMLYRYDGDGCWSDDDGEPVEATLDVLAQCKVPVSAADSFAEQI